MANTVRILSIKAVVCAIVVCIISPANASTLNEIRVGDHDRYTRIVFEFEEPVQYQLPKTTDEKLISILFYSAQSEKPAQDLTKSSECVQAITTRHQGNDLAADIAVRSSRFLMNHFALESPARVVLDVACDIPAESPGAQHDNKPAETKPADIAKTSQPRAVDRKPDVSIKKEVAAKPKASKNDEFQKYMLVLLAAITVFIIIVIGLIIFQRRTHSGKQTPDEMGSIRDTEDMMTALDSEIKERFTKYDKEQH
jgi:hypothetical protein